MSDFNALKFVADNAGLNIFKALEKAYEQGKEDAAKEALSDKDINVPSKSALDHIHNVVRDDAYKRGYEQGKDDAAPTWIPTSERVPSNNDTVLIVHKGGVSTGWWNGRYWERGASSNHRMLKTVTHWMPFPEAPKGE